MDLQSSWAWSRTPFLRGSCRGEAGLCLNDTQPVEQQHDQSTRSRHNHSSPSRSLSTPRPLRTPLPAAPLPAAPLPPSHLLHVPPFSRGAVGRHASPGSHSGNHPTPPTVPKVGWESTLLSEESPCCTAETGGIVHKDANKSSSLRDQLI